LNYSPLLILTLQLRYRNCLHRIVGLLRNH